MMATRQRLALQSRKNPRKNHLQSSQEMINAVDKVSVSVRRAFNVNRCQQDSLEDKVWTLERECRKSLGLLSLEQRKFIKSRKPSMTGINIETKTKRILADANIINSGTQRNASKKCLPPPALVHKFKFQSDFAVRGQHFPFKSDLKKQRGKIQLNAKELIRLPSITETKSRKISENNGNGHNNAEGKNVDISASKENVEWAERKEYASSWNVDEQNKFKTDVAGEKRDPQRKTYSSFKEQPSASKCEEFSRDINHKHVSNNEFGDVAEKIKQLPRPLRYRKAGGIRGNDVHSDIKSDFNTSTEIRVKEFLKLPPIRGIRDPDSLDEQAQQDSLGNPQLLDSDGKRKFGGDKTHARQADETGIRNKSSLWKNLAHCRYLRLNEENQSNITNKTCQCNWCTMMRKHRM